MIKVENIEVFGFEGALRGMRNPMNSWDKADSEFYFQELPEGMIEERMKLGENDLKLSNTLCMSGPEHRKFLRMMHVQMDVVAPLYWWSDKVGTTANSCSKMHKLLEKPFELSDFSFDKLPGYKNTVKQFRPLIDEDMVASEIWIVYDKDYDVSNYGRVKHKLKDRYRIISGSLHSDGYIYVTLHGKQYPVHRLVGKLFHYDNYSDDLVINHKDGNKQNNFAINLEWVTQSENVKHSYANQLQPKPVNTYKGKFTDEERKMIKAYWDSGEYSKKELANMYQVSWTCIDDIIRDRYKYAVNINLFEDICRPWVDTLNELRDSWLNAETEQDKKVIWYTILQLLPESYNQRRTLDFSYETVFNMINQRKNHKLDEWKQFVAVLENLPMVKELMSK